MGGLYRDIELPLIAVLADMEAAGIRVDIYRLAEIAAKLGDQVDELEERAYELAGGPFTLGSPKQLGEILFERLGLPADRKGKTGYSTDARVLAKIRDLHPIVAVIEAWREQSKLLNTYVQPLPGLVDERDGRLHTTFSQTTAATGRLSSIRPNLQNIPIRTPLGREIRGAFVAEDGARLLSADYSQVELRILAHLSDEPALKDAFARGEDIHRVTAAEVLGKPAETLTREERNRAKAVNFGIIYGISAFGLSEQLSISREEAQAYIDTYLARFPHVNEFISRTIASAKELGYVSTLFGRRRPIPELRASGYQTRSLGERLAVNTVMQGSAADIIKVAMIGCHNALRDTGPALSAGAADPRRAVVRGGGGRGRRGQADRGRAHDRCLPARSAAGYRHRRRHHLAGRKVNGWIQISGTLHALPARRGDEEAPTCGSTRASIVSTSRWSCSWRRWRPTGWMPRWVSASAWCAMSTASTAAASGSSSDGCANTTAWCRQTASDRRRHPVCARPPSARPAAFAPAVVRARVAGGGGDHASRRGHDRDRRGALQGMRRE